MLSAPGKASYGYDGHGRRTWVSYADGSWKVQFYSLSGELLFTKHSSQGETRHIGLGRRLLAEQNSASGLRYAHTDALGSPVAWTNASGQLITRTRFEPYGGTAAGTNPTGIGYTGHVNDADTGLVYMQQRYYDPLAGRFLSVDPVVSDPETGKGFALYAYVDDSPYARVDPDGRSPLDLMFLAADLYKFGEAVATGGDIGAAGIDLAASVIGVASPVPGVGQAMKAVRAADKLVDAARGGTYVLRDIEGVVRKTGRTDNLVRRERELGRKHPDKIFEVDKRTDSYPAQRGREQVLHDANPSAHSNNGGLDRINGISPKNPKREEYLEAGRNLP